MQWKAISTVLRLLKKTQAEPVIRDSDMAEEMSKLTGDQIMLQASTAMVSQANQVPRTVLDLIQSNA